MVFASLTFLALFLPLSLVTYALANTQGTRNALLTAFSLLFYAWGEPVWISLLLLSSLSDWTAALVIDRWRGRRAATVALVVSLALNLLLLGSFKYADLITATTNALTGLSLRSPGFSLPVGISFYTFQTISYVVDVWRGDVRAQPRFDKFLLFVSLFHQLVAGPIVRYADVAHDIDHRVVTRSGLLEGASRFCVGLGKKVLLANVAGELVARHLDGDLTALPAAHAWFGLAMYTLQIYFDFSGYSDMAIGMGRMIGFHYLENFDHPYAARSVTDFWRRWHISLGSFFRDYVYIPLGGKHRHPTRNLFVVWGLTGLWHGASWNFVLWGLFHGALIALERLFVRRALERLPRALQHAWLLLVVVVGWALFYFTDLHRLRLFFAAAAGLAPGPLAPEALATTLTTHATWLVVAALLCTPLPGRAVDAARAALRQRRGVATDAVVTAVVDVLLLLLAVALLVGRTYNPFLYFRF
ncbi:MAG: MBOAT family protein [Deltaproteobacteria bacterium]|nr:MBOAT family protein [Deltaproteobacteria bacterium]